VDYIGPIELAAAMAEAARNKIKLAPSDLLIRGARCLVTHARPQMDKSALAPGTRTIPAE
jgi:hypothetical protein